MSLKQVEIIQAGPNVGDWKVQVNGMDITEMVDVITIVVNRARRKSKVLLTLHPDVTKVPETFEAEIILDKPIEVSKPKKPKDK